MNESFQIIATLAAVQLALAMSPGPEGRFVARAGRVDLTTARAAALGLAPAALFWSMLALAALDLVAHLLPEHTLLLRLVCGAHVLRLAIAAVRRAFADHAVVPATPLAVTQPLAAFRLALRAALATPNALAFHASVLGLTGAWELTNPERLLAVATMPIVALAWNLVVAAPLGTTADRTPPRGDARRRAARPAPTLVTGHL